MKKISDYIVGLIIIILVYTILTQGVPYFIKNWSYWFPEEKKVKIDCLLAEQKNSVVSIFGYKQCLIEGNVKIENSDIRKVCFIQARDKYLESRNSTKTENQYYLDCVRSQGLPD